MNLHKLLLTNNDCFKAGKVITPKGIMVHSTGANNPNLKRYVGPDDGLLGNNTGGNHWNKSGTSKCVHAFIGKLTDGSIATYQTLPWNYRGWHCGKSGNDTHISFEICEDALTDSTYFAKVYQEAVELCVYLCKMYGFNPQADGVLICHSEGYKRGIASAHSDVMHWFPKFGKSMDTFRSDVAAKMSGGTTITEPTANGVPDVKYQVHTDKWLPDVVNLNDYAGIVGKSITGIYANSVGQAETAGYLEYRVHLKDENRWLPWVRDREDYAGILGKAIDCVQMRLIGLAGYEVKYRASPMSGNYYSWVTGYKEDTNNSNGYAGVYGKAIDRLQIQIVKA